MKTFLKHTPRNIYCANQIFIGHYYEDSCNRLPHSQIAQKGSWWTYSYMEAGWHDEKAQTRWRLWSKIRDSGRKTEVSSMAKKANKIWLEYWTVRVTVGKGDKVVKVAWSQIENKSSGGSSHSGSSSNHCLLSTRHHPSVVQVSYLCYCWSSTHYPVMRVPRFSPQSPLINCWAIYS